jgi:hypothetical protein
MASLVLTGWCGTEFAKMAAHTLPLLEDYAHRHGHGFACGNLFGPRPPSWQKVALLRVALERHAVVAWIDADVVVADDSSDLLSQLQSGHVQALVEHNTASGPVPNCGVWVLTQAMLPVLASVWDEGRNIDHPWWEQASVMERMGYVLEPGPCSRLDTPTTLHAQTTFLGPEWNHHPFDARRVSAPHMVHVTQYDNRLETIRQLCRET